MSYKKRECIVSKLMYFLKTRIIPSDTFFKFYFPFITGRVIKFWNGVPCIYTWKLIRVILCVRKNSWPRVTSYWVKAKSFKVVATGNIVMVTNNKSWPRVTKLQQQVTKSWTWVTNSWPQVTMALILWPNAHLAQKHSYGLSYDLFL